MNKTYTRINWENYPSDSTPLNEDNLNKIDRALDEVDNRVITLDTTKLGLNVANNMITGFSLDPNTGIITITKYDGSTQTFDTSLEKVAINFEYDQKTERLVITLDDGTEQYVDLSSLVDNYTFSDSDVIAFDVVGKDVSATIKANSITDSMIESEYLANVRVAASEAVTSANNASISANAAKASETNAGNSEAKSLVSEVNAKDSETNAKNSETNAKNSETNANASALSASTSADAALVSETNAKKSETNAKSSEDIVLKKVDEAKGYASTAQTSAKQASSNAILSESYAKGGTGTRQGEDTDNAYYYMQQAKNISGGIPTKLSEMENDVGFVTSTVNNLVYYYTTSVVYTKSEVDTLISNIVTFDILPVEQLPTENISTHTIYLVPTSGSSGNAYLEYIYVGNAWEMIGSTEVDLTNYLQKDGDGSNLTNTFAKNSSMTLVSGETLSISLGKIMKAIEALSDHIKDGVVRTATSSSYGHVLVDSSLSDSSKNPVENKAIYNALGQKLSTSGDGSNVTVAFTESATLSKPVTNESLSTLIGKVARMYTELNQKASTTQLNDVDNKFGTLTFGYTEDGKPGYREAGADTVIPFSTGIQDNVIIDCETKEINYSYFANMLGAGASICNIVFESGDLILRRNSATEEKFYFGKKLDITKYNTLTVVGKGYNNYATIVYISTDGTTVSRSVSIQGNAYVTKTIDVSDLTGEYYVGVSSFVSYIKTLRFD